MEKALQDRLRDALTGVLGSFQDRPTVDWNERRSNERSAFPAIVLSTVSPGREYYQDGADRTTQPRIRAEVFALSSLSVKETKKALVDEMERTSTSGSFHFRPSRLAFERDSDPETLAGGLKVFRTILDFFVPNSPA